jgi:uncharacterized membrane protein YciS (DUF1049 family)
MSFRFYTNMVSQVSRTIAAGIFTTGLVLIGFGFMIYLLPKFFATLAAAVFFIVGFGCTAIAIKIFWAQRQMDKKNSNDSHKYRENVQIHTNSHYDF